MQEIPEFPNAASPPRSFGEILERATPRFWVTPALIALNVAYFAFAVFKGVSPIQPETQQLLDLGANFGPLTFTGQWWRLLTAAFVHIGFIHLAFNMWCLWSLGNVAERMFGNFTFLWIYLLSGIGGSLGSLLMHPSIPSAGASGAVFGIAGALAAMLYFGHILVPRQVVQSLLSNLLFFVGFNLLFGFAVQVIDNAGHIGGLAVGLLLGAALHRSLPSGRRAWQRYLALPVTAVVFAAVFHIAEVRGEKDAELQAANAMLLAAQGKTEASTEAFQKAVALAPDSASIKNQLGTSFMESGRTEEAIALFREAVDLDPQLYEPRRNLAIALALAGRKEEASEASRIALQMRPGDVSLPIESSQRLMEAGRLDDAVAALEEARTWDSESAPIESQMGLVQLRRGDVAKALEAFRKAVTLDPSQPEHHNRLALGLSRAHEGDCGLEEIATALKLLPEAPHLLDTLGTVKLARGESKDAIAAYRRAIALAPELAVYRFNLSVALARDGRSGEAEKERAEALRLDPHLSLPADGEPIL